MVEIISVRFKEGGKHYYFNPNGARFQPGEGVIVETTRGTEFGECVQGNTPIDEMELTAPLRPVLRRATPEDELTREKNKEKEAKALEICQQKILEHGLEMKLVDAEWSFEGNTPASSCARSACGTRPRCWAAWASAGGLSAAPSSWTSSSPCPSRWPRPRTCP